MEKLKTTLEKRDQTILTLQGMLTAQKEQADHILSEKSALEKKHSHLQQQKFTEDLNYENQIRKLKKDLEQKIMQAEQLPRNDHGLMLLKLRSELEEPHQIELLHKDNQIAALQDSIVQLKHKLKCSEERLLIEQQSHQNELQQLKEKYQSDIGNEKLQMKHLKELNLLSQRDQEQIRDLLQEKEQQQKNMYLKEQQVKELRGQLEKEKSSKDLNIQLLTQQLEQERQQRRILESQREELESALQNIRMNAKDSSKFNLVTKSNDDELNELQARLAEYIRLFEDEKDQKRKLTNKLSDIIQQTKHEKLENDKIYENRIRDLMEQLKEEKNVKQKQSVKIKDLYSLIEELKHENGLMKENLQRIDDKERDLQQKERKLLEKEIQLGERESQIPNSKPVDEIMYENKKLKGKYKRVKGKLEEANKKIIVLLAQVKKDPITDNYDRDMMKTKNYKGVYSLPQDADYLNEPYCYQMDRISQRLREDVINQRQQLENIDNKYNQFYQ